MKAHYLMGFFWLLVGICPAFADRDIIYAARYYTPPGSHRTSHFHLYRINPDGTGRVQLTYGESDDDCPVWSPDGRHILFLRREGAVCMADADGRRVKRLAAFGGDGFVEHMQWFPDGQAIAFVHYHIVNMTLTSSALWVLYWKTGEIHRYPAVVNGSISPNGRSLMVDDGIGVHIINRHTGISYRLPPPQNDAIWLAVIWLGNDRLVGNTYPAPMTLHFVRRGQITATIACLHPPRPNPWGSDLTSGFGWPLPSPQPGMVIYALNEPNSTVGTLAFFRVNLANGAMRFLAQGQFLTWSPDGKRFCTAPGRDTWTYHERRWDGAFKNVWAAPLQVGTPGGKLKTVTPGLVWVTGADWRKR